VIIGRQWFAEHDVWRLTVWGFPKGETSQPHEIRALVSG
jgi:hypothetical protein